MLPFCATAQVVDNVYSFMAAGTDTTSTALTHLIVALSENPGIQERVQTLSSVLLSIQSLMNEHPIQNEPGWETETGQKSKDYNNVISFFNIETNIIRAITKTPDCCSPFKDIILKYFVNNIEKYYKVLENNSKLNGKKIKSGIYSMCIDKYDNNYIREELEMLFSKYDILYGK